MVSIYTSIETSEISKAATTLVGIHILFIHHIKIKRQNRALVYKNQDRGGGLIAIPRTGEALECAYVEQ